MGDIYISSLTLMNKSPEEIIRIAKDNDFFLEFSSGMPFSNDMEKLYIEAAIKKMPHNYFPAPEIPFVLNLASLNDKIRNQSVEHCIKGLHLAKQANASFFSAHAGFCIDPHPFELGKKINYIPFFNKDLHKQLFLESVKKVLKEATQLNIQFLIENNVIASFNIVEGENPLLCCESKEIKWLFNAIDNKRLGLLLDTAHLKVSCETLGLKKDDEIKAIEQYVKAIHHSDNDGLVDNNQLMDSNYWFLSHLNKFSSLTHVIEVKNIDIDTIKQQIKLLQAYGC